MLNNPSLRSSLMLSAFALAGVTLVAATYQTTRPHILHNEHLSLLRRLEVLVPPVTIDNDIVNDTIEVYANSLLGANTSLVYRGRKHNQPVAVIINSVIPDGYAGAINLLIAVGSDGILNGVRVIAHKETPGLGDKIEEQKTNWILSFNGKSIYNPPQAEWETKLDGGAFDHITGATITSRAVIHAIRNALIFAEQQGTKLYADSVQ